MTKGLRVFRGALGSECSVWRPANYILPGLGQEALMFAVVIAAAPLGSFPCLTYMGIPHKQAAKKTKENLIRKRFIIIIPF